MRILALDVGQKRIGVAVSDALNLIAQGIETIKREDLSGTLNRISSLVEEYDVSKIIVGLPFNMNGTKGTSVKLTEEFIDELKKKTGVTIETRDERLTTLQGERVLLEANVSRKKRKLAIDKIAAQLILQSYLEEHVQKNKPE
ncbi:Holliday junction resolvase RuvX [Candidatus Omnitrophota bacterium]